MRLLNEVQQSPNENVDIVLNQLVTADLTETQATKLSERIKTLVEMATIDVATLHANLLQAEVALSCICTIVSPL